VILLSIFIRLYEPRPRPFKHNVWSTVIHQTHATLKSMWSWYRIVK